MLDKKIRLGLFREMYYVRLVEEEIAARYPGEQMRCPVHLSIGQEGVPAGFALAVRDTDFAVSTHRGHAHYLAKGGDLGAMIAEIYGKSTGCSKGKGGSMHLIDLSVRFMGSTAIVGNSIPIGVGLGLSSQLRVEDDVSCIFLGDGAVEEGVFFESLNFAAVKKLPVLFVCENNLYSVYSPFRVRQPESRSIARMVEAFGVKSVQADGNDAELVYKTLTEAFREIRNGGGPVFIEFSTYRWREHCGPSFDDDLGYRSDEEVAYWKLRDPIKLLTDKLSREVSDFDVISNEMISQLKAKIKIAFKFAEDSPFPDPSEAFTGVYSHG